MLFNSFIFFIFLGLVWPVFHFLPSKNGKNSFLLVASYVFYGYWDWRFCSLLAITTIIDFFVGKQLIKTEDLKKRKLLLLISLITNLGILGFFKYFNFFVNSFQDLCSVFGAHVDYLHFNIILPIGLSFYVFHNISYILDVYNEDIKPTNNFIDFGLFVSFFPQLVAGPIGRARVLLPQLSKKLTPSKVQLRDGVVLIITGLFRKVIIGDTSGRYVDHIFGNLEYYKSIEIICALILFSIQIYADFSGYSLIALGTAKLFGVELMRNFEQPYLSRNIVEYWRRWHISLSTWLRDYVYTPLTISTRDWRVNGIFFSILITFLISGLWHGAGWNFVLWGGIHGTYIILYTLFFRNKKMQPGKIKQLNIRSVIDILFTFTVVLFANIFFRSTSWHTTHLFFSRIIHWEKSEYALWFIKTTLSFLVLVIALDILDYRTNEISYFLTIKSKPFLYGILMGTFMLTLFFMFQTKVTPFLYFKF